MITAVVPFRDKPELTRHVVDLLRAEPGVRVLMLDNGSTVETLEALVPLEGDLVYLHPAVGRNLYEMWDYGWHLAACAGRGEPYEVAFLNNDVDFLPGTLGRLRDVLRAAAGSGAVCPDYDERVGWSVVATAGARRTQLEVVRGSYRRGGLAGWCFMVKGELRDQGVRPDTGYRWWAGDDDLFAQIESKGYQLGIVRGLPLDHVGEATARDHPWTQEAKARDLARFREKWRCP